MGPGSRRIDGAGGIDLLARPYSGAYARTHLLVNASKELPKSMVVKTMVESMPRRQWLWIALLATLLGLLAAACGSDPTATHEPTATPTAAPTSAPTATPTAAPTSAPTATPTATAIPAPTAATLSLDEYLSVCALLEGEDNLDDDATYGDLYAAMEDLIEGISSLAPPVEVADWHNANLASLEKLKTSIDLFPKDDEIDFLAFFAIAASLEEEERKIQELVGRMPDDVRQRMAEAGCIEDAGTATPETTPTPTPSGPDDHGDDIDSATAISVGESIEGSLQSWDDVDIFRFTAKAGHLYRLGMASSAEFFFAEVYERDPECGDGLCWIASFNSNDASEYQDGPDSWNSWHAEESRDYYIQVERFEPTPYTLTVTDVVDDHANTIAGATPATVGTPVEGVIDWKDDLDYFRFTAQEGQTYDIEAELGTLSEYRMRLLSSDGEELVNPPFEEVILWNAHQSGDYYVEVKGGSLGWETGTYTLNVTAAEDDRGAVLQDDQDQGDFQDDATAISVGESVEGIISDKFERDWFVFNAEAGKEYRIFITLDTLEWSLLLLHSSDSQLVETQNESRLTWQAPESGAYYVEVLSFFDTGTYTLTVGEDDYGDTPEDATAIAIGQLVEGALGYERDGDVFAFQAEAGKTYHFNLVPGTLPAHYLSLWTSDTGWIRLDQLSWVAPLSGEVYLAVWSSEGTTGTYTLTIIVQ